MTTINILYQLLEPDDIHRRVMNGEGDSIGLPVVPDDKIDDVIAAVWDALKYHELDCCCPVCELSSYVCPECSTHTRYIDENDEDHMIALEVVLIGCEGFHTACLRAGAFVTNV